MYDPPAYLWVIIIAGLTAVAATTCVVLYGGAVRVGLGRRRAALLAGAAAVVFGGWLTASAVIAGHGWYRTLPWFPVAVAGYLALLLALRRIPVVARTLAAPGMVSRLELPHTPRVAGVAFLLYLAFGHLPALFALPAGLGDIAAGIAAPLVARRPARARLIMVCDCSARISVRRSRLPGPRTRLSGESEIWPARQAPSFGTASL